MAVQDVCSRAAKTLINLTFVIQLACTLSLDQIKEERFLFFGATFEYFFGQIASNFLGNLEQLVENPKSAASQQPIVCQQCSQTFS